VSKRRQVAYLITALVGFAVGVTSPAATDAWSRAAAGFGEAAVLLAAFWMFGIGFWQLAGWFAAREARAARPRPAAARSAMDRRSFLSILWSARTK